MKLRNKKTGEITNFVIEGDVIREGCLFGKTYYSLAELNEEWENYEDELYYIISAEHKDGYICALKEDYKELCETANELGIGFETEKEAQKAVEKLNAWKRLKDKNFHFLKYSALGCGEIEFSLNFEDMDDEGEIGELRHDLDLLFGGEE